MIKVRRISSQDRELNDYQDAVQQAVLALQATPFQGGRVLKDVELTAGSNEVPHGLQAVPRTWVVTDINAAATIHRTNWTDTLLILSASADCTVSLWVSA